MLCCRRERDTPIYRYDGTVISIYISSNKLPIMSQVHNQTAQRHAHSRLTSGGPFTVTFAIYDSNFVPRLSDASFFSNCGLSTIKDVFTTPLMNSSCSSTPNRKDLLVDTPRTRNSFSDRINLRAQSSLVWACAVTFTVT